MKTNDGASVACGGRLQDSYQQFTRTTSVVCIPIKEMSRFNSHLSIRGRVVKKICNCFGPISAKYPYYFRFLMEDSSGSIQVNVSANLIDCFYSKIVLNQVCVISFFALRKFDPNHTINDNIYDRHNFQIFLREGSEIIHLPDESNCIPMRFNFESIDRVLELPVGTLVDVIGVCAYVSDLRTYTEKKTKKRRNKRDLILTDRSESKIFMTIWDQDAVNFPAGPIEPIVVAHQAEVSNYEGVSLNVGNRTTFQVNMNIEEVNELSVWYNLQRNNLTMTSKETHMFPNLDRVFIKQMKNQFEANKLSKSFIIEAKFLDKGKWI
jgi:hypothetical protein